jgi:hypothetical protein
MGEIRSLTPLSTSMPFVVSNFLDEDWSFDDVRRFLVRVCLHIRTDLPKLWMEFVMECKRIVFPWQVGLLVLMGIAFALVAHWCALICFGYHLS